MSRRHGWQLPAHTLQVVAITVFFLLCIAFYSFFCPFVGKDLYQYVTMGVYSFLALSVLILYVRCTAIDPADPGILIAVGGTLIYKSEMNVETQEDADKSRLGTDGDNQKYKPCLGVGCFCCNIFMKEDCRKDIEAYQQEDYGEEALYCTLCNAEVCKNSKHCRSCDKCVDGFDHHCRWLNNCVGRRNYITFLCLMAVSLAWLAVESGVGIAVLVRCFTNKAAIEDQIGEKLGYGLSRAPFATIVALGTALSLLASVPLGELFFFHMILIRKGITTYEYVVAMRAQSEPPGPSSNDDQQSLPSSPMSSAPTAFSGSSFGRHYKGTWCTPPRIFVDQDEIIPHLQPGRVPSTVDPDYMDPSERVKQHAKRPVRISAWKLAKLDSNEAIKAAAKARASSSVLKPINTRGQYETDQCSSGHLSSRSSAVSGDTGFHRDVQSGFGRNSRFKSSYPPSRASVEDVDTYPQTPSSYQSNSLTPTPIAEHHPSKLFNPIYQTSANRSPFSAKSGDVKEAAGSEINNSRKIGASNAERSSRSSVYWDQEAGRFVSAQSNQASSSRSGRADLLYTGQSIFFGGPLVADPATRSFRDPGSSQRSGGSQLHQLPVFVPSDPQKDELSKLP